MKSRLKEAKDWSVMMAYVTGVVFFALIADQVFPALSRTGILLVQTPMIIVALAMLSWFAYLKHKIYSYKRVDPRHARKSMT